MSVSPRKDLGKESKRGAGIGLSLGASKNSPRKDQDKSFPRKDQEKNSPRKEQEDGEEKEKYCKNSICEEFKKSQKLAIYELNITIKKLKEDITKLKVENKVIKHIKYINLYKTYKTLLNYIMLSINIY